MPKSLMSVSLGTLMKYAASKGLHPSQVEVLSVFPKLAERDISRGGGRLKTEDLLILDLLATEKNMLLSDVIEEAKRILPPGHSVDTALVSIVDEDEPSVWILNPHQNSKN